MNHKIIVLASFGGYDKMKVEKMPRPCVQSGKVIVAMKACGMNFSDILNRQGIHTFHDIRPPFVLGVEGAGIITAVGENVTGLKIGDRVMCWNFTYGMWAEYVTIPATHCCIIPEIMTFEQAAAIPINYITAYFAVLDYGHLRPGQSILIQSAAGGVGWAATQLAKTVENVTIFGTASSAKHDTIKENGVTHTIDYRSADFVDEVLKVSPEGVNIVVDCLSGSDFIRSQKLLKNMGRLIHIGISNAIDGEKRNWLKFLKVWWSLKNISILNLIDKNNAVCGLNIANLQETDPELFRHALKHILDLFERGQISPKIDSIWSFEQVAEAQKHMTERKNIGKIILVPNKPEDETAEATEEQQ